MEAVIKLIITILFGWTGLHKFLDEKPKQGIVYIFTFGLMGFGWIIDIVSTAQYCKKIEIKKIEDTRQGLGLLFSGILFLYCIVSIGASFFSWPTFIISLISGIALLNFFLIESNNHNFSYEKSKNKIRDEIEKKDNKSSDIKMTEFNQKNNSILTDTKYKNIIDENSVLVEYEEDNDFDEEDE